jgi:hypothetical protein
MIKRIALVGASSTGKTTVFELLKTRLLKYEFISESTRSVNSFGFDINEQGTDLTQLAISTFHLKHLIDCNKGVYDRCYLDLVVYTKNLEKVSSQVASFIEANWGSIMHEYTHYVYFPIEFDSVDDGTRSVNEDWRRAIDDYFKYRLDVDIKNYLTVTGSPLNRVDQILNFINK